MTVFDNKLVFIGDSLTEVSLIQLFILNILIIIF
jgi:hypothetical protein